MPPLREVREHMQSIEGITKVIHALEIVSSATSHRLQERVERAQAYAVKSWEMLSHLAAADEEGLDQHVALRGHPAGRPLGLILISSNRGMAGAYDASVIRTALDYVASQSGPSSVIAVGRRGQEAALRRGIEVHADFSHLDERAELEDVTPLATLALDGYLQGVFGRIAIAYTDLHRGALLRAHVRQLLPVQLAPVGRLRQYILEPGAAQLLETLLPRIIRFQIHAALVESLAAEHASRAIALRTATNNAGDIIRSLTLDYNKSRQEAITADMVDIISAAMALRRRS